MKEAIILTITDFEIELRNCSFWDFKYTKWLNAQIKHYQKELEKIKCQSGQMEQSAKL